MPLPHKKDKGYNVSVGEPKVAIIHDYLTQNGGAERVLEAIHDIFPDSTVFTTSFDPKFFPESYSKWDIRTTPAENLPFFKALSKQYTFLYPIFFELFDLSEFDIVISSWSAWSKGVITNPKQLHVSYCHTPPRFLYKYKGETSKRSAWYYKPFVAYIDSFLRVWDFASAQNPDYLIANSQNVKKRISKFYRRDADVIYPPLKFHREIILPQVANKFTSNYYLIVSRLAAYKNLDLAIEAFNFLELPLRIVGAGKEGEKLRKMIKGDIALMGRVDDRELTILYQNCKATIFPVSDEDLGISVLESLSHGKPVLAHRSGGVLETIEDGKTGMFFDDLSTKGLIKAIQKFDLSIMGNQFDQTYLKHSVEKFDENNFKKTFYGYIMQKWQEKKTI